MTPDSEGTQYDSLGEALLYAMFEGVADGCGVLTLHDMDCDAITAPCNCDPTILSIPPEIPEAL